MRVGSFCSGYGGLDEAVLALFPGASIAWHVEYADAPSRILAHHWPEVPNHRDLRTLDLSTVEPVEIVTAGYPCQPFSAAGRRLGEQDERHLWPNVRDAIRYLRPRFTFLENVAGHRSLGFDRVLGDLAEDGFDARWTSIRAADVGAAHGRERLFVLVTPADSGVEGLQGGERAGRSGPAVGAGPDSGGQLVAGRGETPPDAGRDGLRGGAERDGEPVEPGLETPHGDDSLGRGPATPDATGARLSRAETAGGDRGDAAPGSRAVEPQRGSRTQTVPDTGGEEQYQRIGPGTPDPETVGRGRSRGQR